MEPKRHFEINWPLAHRVGVTVAKVINISWGVFSPSKGKLFSLTAAQISGSWFGHFLGDLALTSKKCPKHLRIGPFTDFKLNLYWYVIRIRFIVMEDALTPMHSRAPARKSNTKTRFRSCTIRIPIIVNIGRHFWDWKWKLNLLLRIQIVFIVTEEAWTPTHSRAPTRKCLVWSGPDIQMPSPVEP